MEKQYSSLLPCAFQASFTRTGCEQPRARETSSARPGLVDGLFDLLARLVEAREKARAERRTMAALRAMSDHQLRDIGIDRRQLPQRLEDVVARELHSNARRFLSL